MLNVGMAFVGVGVGYLNSSYFECDENTAKRKKNMEKEEVFGWSMNFKQASTNPETFGRWTNFANEVMNVNKNITEPGLLITYLHGFRKIIYDNFHRMEDCGKETKSYEKRCLHHVISPFEANQKNYLKFLDNDFQSRVSYEIPSVEYSRLTF